MAKPTGSDFLEKTKIHNLEPSDQQRGIPQPSLERPFDPAAQQISLPGVDILSSPLVDFCGRRRSVRQFSDESLNTSELSTILWCTQGVHQIHSNNATFRSVPSAGARHAFETYLFVNRVETLPQGLYRYLALSHRLILISDQEGLKERLTAAVLGQSMVKHAAVTAVWVADIPRMTWRYGQRGYRYLLLDAGHVGQNLYLAADACGCVACVIGAYDDNELNTLLGLDGEEQYAVYLGVVGKPQSTPVP